MLHLLANKMKVQTLEEIEKYWSSFAGWYDSNISKPNSKFYSAMLPFLDITPESTILETACGSGHGLELLLEVAAPSQIIGTDLAEGMLNISRLRFGDRLNLQIANNEELPFEENSFSQYISGLSLHIVPSPERMLAEAYRVLKPGGQIAVSVIGNGTSFIQFTRLANSLASKTSPDPEARTHMHLADQSKALGLLRDAGFERILRFSERHAFPIKTSQLAADWFCSLPVLTKLQTDDPDHFQEVRAGVLREAENLIDLEGRPIEFVADIYIARKPAS